MEITVKRIVRLNTYTQGRLYVNGEYWCDTLEPPVRALGARGELKKAGQTAIPQGTYNVSLSLSPRFKRVLPLIEDVPFFTGVRIHAGNSVKNTAGCILVGAHTLQMGVLKDSRLWEKNIIEAISKCGEKVRLTIYNITTNDYVF